MKLILILGYIMCGWLCVASLTYALRHPEQTDTQRLLNFKGMMLFE
jgi:hypothetical protein